MRTNAGFSKKMRAVMIIAICWTLFSGVSFISEYFFVYDLVALKKLSGSFPFWPEFIASLLMGLFGGLAAGWLLVFKLGSRYSRYYKDILPAYRQFRPLPDYSVYYLFFEL